MPPPPLSLPRLFSKQAGIVFKALRTEHRLTVPVLLARMGAFPLWGGHTMTRTKYYERERGEGGPTALEMIVFCHALGLSVDSVAGQILDRIRKCEPPADLTNADMVRRALLDFYRSRDWVGDPDGERQCGRLIARYTRASTRGDGKPGPANPRALGEPGEVSHLIDE